MNKTILVVGASGGIGRKVVEDLLAQGYSVIGTHNETQYNISNVKIFRLDFLNPDSIKKFVKELENISLYGLVNCAGIVEYEGINIEKDLETWNKTIQVNLTANYILAKYFGNNIEKEGRFIMISSTDSMYGGSITASYSASKAGVNSLAKSLSLLFKDKKITVNAIAPGWVNTRMIEDSGKDFIKAVADINPLKRIADPKDISNIIMFLLKKESGYVNGQVITVDGGYTNQDPTLLIEEENVS